jgi:hypothetical protein
MRIGDHSSTMDSESTYKVIFGRMARTLIYEDSAGTLLFTFDVSRAKADTRKEWNLHLDKRPLVGEAGKFVLYDHDSQIEQERVAKAFERVEQYASSCGYFVLVE